MSPEPVSSAPTLPRGIRFAGFTMIEIAISLAVIGFALVAIIGILPTGMNVQRENREETIINQDATVLINSIRNGARGGDDLTNYVVAISNYVVRYNATSGAVDSTPGWLWHTYNGSGPASFNPGMELTNGTRIVGILSTPRYTPDPVSTNYYRSNYVVAMIRSMSGPASEKAPQRNASVQELALNYRLITDISPAVPYDPWQGQFRTTNDVDYVAYSNHWAFARNIQSNLHNVRLTFRWPVLPDGRVGGFRQTYRTELSGRLAAVQDPWHANRDKTNYFFEARNYVKAPLP
ncbi:MAG TPA: type II secretion system protein [Clostridia bacterium]|nr:type II secretion system protein [Clostridia bacterium]